jgi:hypothetical protein
MSKFYMGTTPLTNQVFFTDDIINSDDYNNPEGETRVAEIIAAIVGLGYKGVGYTYAKFSNGRTGYCYEYNLDTPEGNFAQLAYRLFLAGEMPPTPEEFLASIKYVYKAKRMKLPTPSNSSRSKK